MVDELKAIELIFKLIPQLKSLTGARRREYFDKTITQLFAHLTETHDFYVSIMIEARESILAASRDAALGGKTEVELQQEFAKIIERFLHRRMKDEGLRDSLRQEAQEIFAELKWTEERRFVVLVMYYFLDIGGVAPSGRNLDDAVANVVERGGLTKWPTPSIRLYLDLRKCVDKQGLLDLLDSARDSLNQRYMNARLAYKALERAIVQQT